ncbi:MAG: transporter [Acidobacteriota bacterium]
MRLRTLGLVLALTASAPAAARAQSFNLRDLLTDFLHEGITLAPPAAGFSHQAHFIGEDSPQFTALQQFNSELANQLSSFPLASSAGGFTYNFDPALGVFTRASDSFGPIYAERAETIGKGKLNAGINYSHFTFDRIDALGLREGDARLVFTHQDTNQDHTNLEFWFEGDVITARLFLKVDTDITAFVLTYGVTDRLDVGVAVPIVRVGIEAQTDATIVRQATGIASPIHTFVNGGTAESFRQNGSASGVGDVVLRGKLGLLQGRTGGLALAADVRVPTGEEQDLLGTGSTQVKGYLVGSLHLGSFSPHINAGYNWTSRARGGRDLPDEIAYTGGFDWALSPRLTFAADVLGRTYRRAQVVRVVDTTFQYNVIQNPAAPPEIHTAVFPRLVSETRDTTTLLGSAGLKINPFGNFLLTINGLFALDRNGLQDRFSPLVGFDYSF